MVQDLGAYEVLSRAQACDPKALMKLLPLVKGLLNLEATAEIAPKCFMSALVRMLADKPELNKTSWNGKVWANLKAERLGTLLFHVRRLARDPDYVRQLVTKLSGADFAALAEVVGMVELRVAGPMEKSELSRLATTPLGKGSSSSSRPEDDAMTLAYSDEGSSPLAKGRKLRKTISDASVDSQGFPKMLNECPSPAQSTANSPGIRKRIIGKSPPLEKGKRQVEAQDDEDDAYLKIAMGFAKKQPSKKGSKPSSPKAESSRAPTPLKKGGTAQASKHSGARKPWWRLRKHRGNNPEKAYIVGSTQPGAKKLPLIVEVTRARSPHYNEVADQILEALQTQHITKEEALQMRADLCTPWL